MSTRVARFSSWAWGILVLLAAFLTVLPACSSDPLAASPPTAITTTAEATQGDYSIKAYISVGGKAQPLVFRPTAAVGTVGADPGAGGLRPQDVPFAVTNEGSAFGGAARTVDIARMAISSCGAWTQQASRHVCPLATFVSGRPYEYVSGLHPTFVPTSYQLSAPPPGASCPTDVTAPEIRQYGFFLDEPRTAQAVLQYSESLLCAANRLADLANSEKPTTWDDALKGLIVTVPTLPATPTRIAGIDYDPGSRYADIFSPSVFGCATEGSLPPAGHGDGTSVVCRAYGPVSHPNQEPSSRAACCAYCI
jgi:hypothetical protein